MASTRALRCLRSCCNCKIYAWTDGGVCPQSCAGNGNGQALSGGGEAISIVNKFLCLRVEVVANERIQILDALWVKIEERGHVSAPTTGNSYQYSRKPNIGTVSLIPNLKRRTILRPTLPFIIHPRCRNITMPQPLLHLGDVGIVGQGVGGRRGPHGMHTDARDGVNQADLTGIMPHNVLVDGYGMQGFGEGLRAVVLDGSEERAFQVLAVPASLRYAVINRCAKTASGR